MPIYVYECRKCGHQFELAHGVNDGAKKRCPKCKGGVKKVFTPVGIMFKGSGFYCTDLKNISNGMCKTAGGNGKKPISCSSCDRPPEN